MNEIVQQLSPSVPELGKFIQEHTLLGYRLKEGWPIAYGWQYEVIMTLDEAVAEESVQEPDEQATEDKPKRGRKAAQDK